MTGQSNPTVLYVDDDPDTRLTFRWLFERAGFSFQEAGTGADALRLAGTRPDVVVLDVSLPDMSGFEVCRRLKAHPGTTHIPVLHVSAVYSSPQDRTHGLEEGADAYLTKPVEPGELLAHVNALLRVHQAEERARAEARHWQTTFDAMRDGVCLLDRRGLLVRCNAALARLHGKPVGALLGASYRGLTPGAEEKDLPFVRMLASGRREVAEVSIGDRRLQTTADPLVEAGQVMGAVYLLADVTEQRQLEERLRQAEKLEAIGRLAGGVAHDFNNLLTIIAGNVGLLLAQAGTSEATRTLLQATEKAAWRAADVVQQLLSFSRQTAPSLRRVDLRTCVAEAVEILQAALGPRINIQKSCPADLAFVSADLGQITQVILNLCLNARDAMPEGGQLTLELSEVKLTGQPSRPGGSYVRLAVSDTGPGIAADVLPYIFDPFFTTKPIGQGHGLGLAVVFGIVKKHGGWIEYTGVPGQGARFEVYLPALAG